MNRFAKADFFTFGTKTSGSGVMLERENLLSLNSSVYRAGWGKCKVKGKWAQCLMIRSKNLFVFFQ